MLVNRTESATDKIEAESNEHIQHLFAPNSISVIYLVFGGFIGNQRPKISI